MDNEQLHRFQRLIASRTGWHIRPRDRVTLGRTLDARIRGLALARSDDYLRLLEGESAASAREWKHLAAHLTNRESYFFRDKGQMAALRDRILPELIAASRPQRSLRVWSAGCSTGEEAYTLAILLHELIPDREGWRLSIGGTDINEQVLEAARRAVYSAWSFRMVDPEVRTRYFHEQGGGFHLDPRIREMVRFRQLNLLLDRFPDPAEGLDQADLILCRNVFIYFEPEAVPTVLRKMAATLREGGYLMTGHAEIHSRELGSLQPRTLPGSVVYQRAGRPPTAGPAPHHTGFPTVTPAVPRLPRPHVALKSPLPVSSGARLAPPSLPETDGLAAAEANFQRGDYRAALASLEQLLARDPRHFGALCLMARSYANLGDHQCAARYCRRASEAQPLAVAPYAVLASIAEEAGDLETAKECLKKVLYLAPASVSAHLNLGAIYEREGETTRAHRMRASALNLLDGLQAETLVEGYGNWTAGDLARHVRQLAGERT